MEENTNLKVIIYRNKDYLLKKCTDYFEKLIKTVKYKNWVFGQILIKTLLTFRENYQKNKNKTHKN